MSFMYEYYLRTLLRINEDIINVYLIAFKKQDYIHFQHIRYWKWAQFHNIKTMKCHKSRVKGSWGFFRYNAIERENIDVKQIKEFKLNKSVFSIVINWNLQLLIILYMRYASSLNRYSKPFLMSSTEMASQDGLVYKI